MLKSMLKKVETQRHLKSINLTLPAPFCSQLCSSTWVSWFTRQFSSWNRSGNRTSYDKWNGFLQARRRPCHPTNSVKALKADMQQFFTELTKSSFELLTAI